MRQSELQRFFKDLSRDSALKLEAERAGGITALAALAQARGYGVSADELTALAAQGKDLDEGDLAAIAAGASPCVMVGMQLELCIGPGL